MKKENKSTFSLSEFFVFLYWLVMTGIILYSFCGFGFTFFKYVIPDYIYDASLAKQNAKEIVKKYEQLDDIDKLKAYYVEICNLTDYSHSTADASSKEEYFNVSTPSSVFDNDKSTKTMCLGYAMSFKYLCDNSNFNNNIKCAIQTGTIINDGHAWNIVTINNERYFLDCCWADSNLGINYTYFLIPMKSHDGNFSIATSRYLVGEAEQNNSYVTFYKDRDIPDEMRIDDYKIEHVFKHKYTPLELLFNYIW